MKIGFPNWKNATGESGKLIKHSKSRMHMLSAERMHCFKSTTPIDVQLNKEAEEIRGRRELQRVENRHIVETIFDVVRHLAKQNSSFRGHDERDESKNKGNFLEELEFLSKYHAPLRKWMDSHPENVSYFSHVSQNEMISILSNLIAEVICNEVRTARYFSIQCDEVTSHKKAFMSVILRYVTDFKITERCIKLVRVSNLTGHSLANVIVDILKDLKLPVKDLIGKGFDGAANMSGKDEGVQRHLTEGAEFSIYFHCFAHKLNLVLEQSVETVPSVKEIFETIGDIYRYMEGSPKRHKVYENHLKASAITSGKTALHSFSDTRWIARTANLEVLLNVYPALLSMFQEQSEQNNDSVATGLHVRLIQFRFLAACLILKKCFSLSTHASEYLQREDMDLTSGVAAIHDLKATLASFRNDQQFEMFLAEANSFAEKCGSEVLDGTFTDSDPTMLQNKRRRTLPTHLADGQNIIDMPTLRCNRPQGESEVQRFRREFYFLRF